MFHNIRGSQKAGRSLALASFLCALFCITLLVACVAVPENNSPRPPAQDEIEYIPLNAEKINSYLANRENPIVFVEAPDPESLKSGLATLEAFNRFSLNEKEQILAPLIGNSSDLYCKQIGNSAFIVSGGRSSGNPLGTCGHDNPLKSCVGPMGEGTSCLALPGRRPTLRITFTPTPTVTTTGTPGPTVTTSP